MHIDALSVLCAQLTRDLLAIAKFLFITGSDSGGQHVASINVKFCMVGFLCKILPLLVYGISLETQNRQNLEFCL